MLKYILFLSLLSFNSMATTPVEKLVNFLNTNKQKVLDLAKQKYEYTYINLILSQKIVWQKISDWACGHVFS